MLSEVPELHFTSMISQQPQEAGVIYPILGRRRQRCREVSQMVTDSSSDLPESKVCASNRASNRAASSLSHVPIEHNEQAMHSTFVIPHARTKPKGKCDPLEWRTHVWSSEHQLCGWVWTPSPSLTSKVLLIRLLSLSRAQCPHLENGYKRKTCDRGSLGELHDVMCVKLSASQA